MDVNGLASNPQHTRHAVVKSQFIIKTLVGTGTVLFSILQLVFYFRTFINLNMEVLTLCRFWPRVLLIRPPKLNKSMSFFLSTGPQRL